MTSNLELEFQFEDYSTEKVTLGPLKSAVLTGLKNRIKTFNNQTSPDWKPYFISENGSSLLCSGTYPNVPIKNATIINVTETAVI